MQLTANEVEAEDPSVRDVILAFDQEVWVTNAHVSDGSVQLFVTQETTEDFHYSRQTFVTMSLHKAQSQRINPSLQLKCVPRPKLRQTSL